MIDSHIVSGVLHQATGWHRVIRVDNGAEPSEHSMWVRTVVVGIAKKIFFEPGRPASIFIPMVVKLVGQ